MNSQSKKRWLPRFGLRWLLIAVAVLTPLLGFVGKEAYRRWEERRRAEEQRRWIKQLLSDIQANTWEVETFRLPDEETESLIRVYEELQAAEERAP